MSAAEKAQGMELVREIPVGSIAKIKADVTAVTVQGRAIFDSAPSNALDRDWDYAELRVGVDTLIGGPGYSWLRINSVLQPGATVRVDIQILHDGDVIRHRYWELDGGPNGKAEQHGLVIVSDEEEG